MTLTGLTRLAGVFAGTCALTTMGCSDSPPTPAQGASHLTLVYSGSTSCNIGSVSAWNIPSGSLTNSTTVGSQVVDGSGGSNVSCTVKQAGSGYSVTGSLTSADQIQFSVQGSLSPGSGSNVFQGTGSIGHYSPTSQAMSGTDCTITVSQTQGAQIGPGKIWADFDCPTFKSSAAGSLCEAQGTFVFGNCAD